MNSSSFSLENEGKTIDALNKSVIEVHSTRFKNIKEDNIPYRIDEDGYMIVHKANSEIIYDEEFYFDYRINSDGYRSNHFKQLDSNSINILYAGCSFTFGEGLPESLTWTHMLTEKIKNIHPDKKVEHFNLSQPGAGIVQVIRVCFEYFKKYGKPDYLFLMIPDVLRGMSWVNYKDTYETIIPDINNMSIDPFYKKYLQSLLPENLWLQAVDIMRMVEQYCESEGISLVWSGPHDTNIWKQLDYKFFLRDTYLDYTLVNPKAYKIKEEVRIKDNLDNLPYWECARDGAHPGSCWSTYQATSYFNELKKRAKDEKN